MIRAVLDTNIIVSAVISKNGIPAKIFNKWRELKFMLISSADILQEVKKTFHYPRIMQRYNLTNQDIADVLNLIEQQAVIVPGTTKITAVKEDPDDNKFLSAAIEAEASYLVSGDNHLILLREYNTIKIITAAKFNALI